jgi:dihydropteroate synthase
LIIQALNLSFPEVFSNYSKLYKIPRDKFINGLIGLEFRGNSTGQTAVINKMFLESYNVFNKYNENENNSFDILILGSLESLRNFSQSIASEEEKILIDRIIDVINNYENFDKLIYKIGSKEFNFKNAYVMGILNVTPDSFSDGGKYFNKDSAIEYGLQLLDQGADILDIGGESTRPGAEQVSVDEEINRILPVIKSILSVRKDAVISIDTSKIDVAEESLKSGAKIINDISGLTFNPGLINIVKKYKASVIIMHIKGNPGTMQDNPEYNNLIQEVYDFLFSQTQIALNAGVKNIFIDPGIGFGKTIDHNFEIIKRIGDLKSLGFPIIIGNSRKSFIGKTLNLDPDERDAASAVVNAVSINNGVRIIRTHNVPYGIQTVKLINKIC